MAEQELVIEEAKVEDALSFWECLQGLIAETDFITVDATAIQTHSEAQLFLQEQERSLTNICLVAKLGTQIIGLVNVVTGNGFGDVFIGVRQAYWGHGIGRLLLEMVQEWAEQTPMVERLSLSVQARNSRALALYQNQGFEIVTVSEDGVKTKNGEVLAVYQMVKELAKA